MGVRRWMIEIGYIDINTEVSLLSSHSSMLREAFGGSTTYHG